MKTNPKDCKYYKEGTICEKCTLILTEEETELDYRFKVIHNLEDAKTREDLKFSCAHISDALLYLVWDSPDAASPLFDKRDTLIGGQAVEVWFSGTGENFQSGYRYTT